MKYVYPAIFTPDGSSYSVSFPDLKHCYTCGDNLIDAMEMARDALALMLCHYEDEKVKIPSASSRDSIDFDKKSFINDIACDTTAYRKLNNSRAIKKTLTIPEWLNEAAMQEGINFSKVLQEALMERLLQ